MLVVNKQMWHKADFLDSINNELHLGERWNFKWNQDSKHLSFDFLSPPLHPLWEAAVQSLPTALYSP